MYNDRKRPSQALAVQRRTPAPRARARTAEEAPLFKKIILSSLWGIGINAASGILLVSLLSFIAFQGSDPLSLIPSLSLLALLPSNFIGGFVSAKKAGEAAFSCGMASAAIWCILSLALSLCLYSAPSSGYGFGQGLLLHLASALFCILGALAGGIKRKPSRRKRRFG